ncbi:E3 ubiquitin-protein ligase TRIM35 isoform X1 [Nerophis ophidion]|uniref:E3 ubiquitin-protein ligase TRIM35 isoform X1 n=1 Tax=Nerophis ophidion TaxID=159077 RepID=UPI002ADF06B5|nr:E3 ubiquitin-protein ligase TRIM35 isoform X1 [Nerophis ophidion]XP_061761148.1 E3 ubiquitin-protein ligase TRIM35 isoform X1 [Nerophis ophidion]XP_061761149.1 E3 ubiquitin-protein ligase TRIM35 isoform X1 [Nerophis ophidion]
MALRPRASSQPGKLSFLQSSKATSSLRPRAVSSRSGSVLEDELSCPVCCEIFREPVVLKCSHSFCRACLQQFWNKKKARRECPICRRKCSLTEPTVSLALKNVADTFLREQQRQEGGLALGTTEAKVEEVRCGVHGEVLKLFCLDDLQVLCCVCHTSKKHQGHGVCPLEEGAHDLKEELKKELIPVKKNLRRLYEAKQECDDTTVHIQNQAQASEKQVREDFEQLRDFLQKEEAARLAALQQEEEEKRELVRKKSESITRDILTFSHAVIAVENEIASGDALFLQNYPNTKKRAQLPQKDPEKVSGALIDVAKHVSSLKYHVWEKMVDMVQYTPITLDPNTAYSWLSISKDLTSVANSGSLQQLPANPERFGHFVFALGSEGFSSGRHAWEVEVGDKVDWMLGVVRGSVDRKGRISGCPEGGFWMISHYEGEYSAMTRPSTRLQLEGELTRVRVQLDYDAGEVTFSNPISMMPIYTFKDFFTDIMYPFFCPGANINGNNPDPLKICPATVAVWNSATW